METSAATPRIFGKRSLMNKLIYDPVDLKKPFITIIGLADAGANGSYRRDPCEKLYRLAKLQNVRLVLPDAPTRQITLTGESLSAWYDLREDSFTNPECEADLLFINESMSLIQTVIDEERRLYPSAPIWLAGFSQGATMAILTGLNQLEPIAGIVALSGYVPDHPRLKELSDIARQIPIFMAHGALDTVISISKSRESFMRLNQAGANVEFFEYPMNHEISPQEIEDIGDFIRAYTTQN